MTRFMLVPGACHGGWWYEPVVKALRGWPDCSTSTRSCPTTATPATGLAVEPLPFFDRRARPHPLGTLMQRSKLTGAYKTIKRKRYVAATGRDWLPHSPFTGIAESLRQDPDWTVTDLDSGHNLLANGPDDLVATMLTLA